MAITRREALLMVQLAYAKRDATAPTGWRMLAPDDRGIFTWWQEAQTDEANFLNGVMRAYPAVAQLHENITLRQLAHAGWCECLRPAGTCNCGEAFQ
jgi:hypothetical protein